jgi:Leucine-rich repeat (LRR) protein
MFSKSKQLKIQVILAFIACSCFFNIKVTESGILLNRTVLEEWYGSNLTMQTEMNLGWKEIESIHPDTFRNLTNLSKLNLSHNELIGRLNPTTFNGLINLQILSLDYNRMSGPLGPATFKGLTNLQQLILSNNRLRGELDVHLFTDLLMLHTLDLSVNELSSIANDTFISLAALRLLDVRFNNFTLPIDPEKFHGLSYFCLIFE